MPNTHPNCRSIKWLYTLSQTFVTFVINLKPNCWQSIWETILSTLVIGLHKTGAHITSFIVLYCIVHQLSNASVQWHSQYDKTYVRAQLGGVGGSSGFLLSLLYNVALHRYHHAFYHSAWRCGTKVRCQTCDQEVMGLSQLGRNCITSLGKLLTPTCLNTDCFYYYMESLNW